MSHSIITKIEHIFSNPKNEIIYYIRLKLDETITINFKFIINLKNLKFKIRRFMIKNKIYLFHFYFFKILFIAKIYQRLKI